ncbi:MAG: thymidine phosphorylase, partial [Gemmatimonadota bacterium]
MIPYRVIEAKREGRSLAPPELDAFFRGYLAGEVHEYQMAAFLMAVHFQGLDPRELSALTGIMVESGRRLDLSWIDGPRVDKHSTGGVGDKVSLVLAPLAAELGLHVPMLSGRGLGHTGGTLDKLEAIPGFRTDLSLDDFRTVLSDVGCAMIGQTSEIAPLDRRLYDLRSVTATVPAIPLIAASIMSKKLAEDLTGLVLDVKVGEGAFVPEEERALELARTMVGIGDDRGVPTVALLTAMDRPLGRAVGNALETAEAVACLRGDGPPDLRAVVLTLAAEMGRVGEGRGTGTGEPAGAP